MSIEMKMVRTILNLLALLSLLLCIGVVVLWVRGASRNTDDGISDEEEFAVRLVRRGATTSLRYECGIACESGMMWYVFEGSAAPADPGWDAKPGWSTVCARSTSGVMYFAPPGGPRWWSRFHLSADPRAVAWFPAENGKMVYSIGRGAYVHTPYWVPACLLGIAPAGLLVRRIRLRRRSRRGLCAQCGYDLRATPDRCRECGAAPDSPRAAK
jgi:hypothetical protein